MHYDFREPGDDVVNGGGKFHASDPVASTMYG